jgi:putative hemolysin
MKLLKPINFIALLVLLLLVAACGRNTPNPDPDPDPTTHTLTVTVNEGQGTGTVTAETADGQEITLTETAAGSGVLSAEVEEGTTVVLTATPDDAATMDADWSNCSQEDTTANTCTVTVNADTSVSVAFVPVGTEPTTHTLTVTVDQTNGTGTVSAQTAEGAEVTLTETAEGSGVWTAEVEEGTTVVLTATPADATATDANWTGCDSTDAAANTCTVTVNEDTSVTVAFGPVATGPFALAVTVTGEGSVTSNPEGINCTAAGGETCTAEFEQGTEVTLTATPGTDLVADWGGACETATGNTCTVTVNADTSVSVAFVPVDPNSGLYEQRVAASSDDAEEFLEASNAGHLPGFVHLTSTDLDLIYDSSFAVNQAVGLRFTNLDIPQGATITNAYIQFTALATITSATNLQIAGQAADNVDTFANTSGSITSRTPTTANVAWSVPGWTENQAGANERTPDLSAIVQEVVNRTNWTSGNAVAFIITGNTGSRRRAVSFDGNADAAPLLVIEWTMTE